MKLSRERAFTLVELLATAALTALLLVAVLHVSGSLAASQARAKRAQIPSAASQRIIELLRRDLVQARTMKITEDELTLDGFGALDEKFSSSQTPARVIYRIEQTGGRSWLVRRQQPLSALENRTMVELVCPNVEQFTLGPVADAATKTSGGRLADELALTLIQTNRPTVSAVLRVR